MIPNEAGRHWMQSSASISWIPTGSIYATGPHSHENSLDSIRQLALHLYPAMEVSVRDHVNKRAQLLLSHPVLLLWLYAAVHLHVSTRMTCEHKLFSTET